jgi:uncharacterized DUF497 family protein
MTSSATSYAFLRSPTIAVALVTGAGGGSAREATSINDLFRIISAREATSNERKTDEG